MAVNPPFSSKFLLQEAAGACWRNVPFYTKLSQNSRQHCIECQRRPGQQDLCFNYSTDSRCIYKSFFYSFKCPCKSLFACLFFTQKTEDMLEFSFPLFYLPWWRLRGKAQRQAKKERTEKLFHFHWNTIMHEYAIFHFNNIILTKTKYFPHTSDMLIALQALKPLLVYKLQFYSFFFSLSPPVQTFQAVHQQQLHTQSHFTRHPSSCHFSPCSHFFFETPMTVFPYFHKLS